ncbi:DNA primase [Tengunoibacter tsumagoiensis]|uniref:DNA primase n=1 Tax=Tengunoibacter tsumagoiensis TaxID=2014871 RepID=A0A401ZVG1_9CHLR|nr:DNA primase [Tengunoibacter tsumagoiensis]GCE10714.1 hypothetical protein KTT_05730 [Tengunoibacter tsumagoiensis]
MTSVIETIKTKIDLVDEIGLVVTLQKSGRSLKGLCPFHNERTPSFYVFRESQTWHCFGCNEGGDVFSFVQKQQGLDFHEALAYLAEKAGVSADAFGPAPSEEDRQVGVARERLRKLNEEAFLWFHQMLLRSKEGEQARNYVQSRGISTDSVIGFGLGYASEQWDGLSRYLLSQGYSEREIVQGGLARERETSFEGSGAGIYDYFRHRLIFPIRDSRGRIIGFGGRALGDGKPKYLNSPQTLLFEKNTVLYAIDAARDAIKQMGQVIIVEGYVDAIIAHQYGTKQTVACIGSAITEKHILQLKKLTRQVTLALDPDAAGSAATEHGIQEALRSFDRTMVPVPLASSTGEARASKGQPWKSEKTGKFGKQEASPRGIIRLEEQVDAEINVLQLPAGEDPDEVIRRDFSAWLYAVSHPLPLVDYYFVVKTAELNLREPAGKTEAAKRLLPVIGTISDRIKRDAYIRKLANLIKIDEQSLYTELQRVLRNQKTPAINADFSGKGLIAPEVHRSQSAREGVGLADTVIVEEEEGRAKNVASRTGLDRSSGDRLKWEDYLIGLLLQNPGLSPYVCGIITDSDFAGTDTRELYHILNSVYQRDASPSHQPIDQFVPSALSSTVARALKCVESRSAQDGSALVKEATQCAGRLKRMRLLQLNTELKFLIQEATDAGDLMAARQLRQRVPEIQRQLLTINTAIRLQG